MKAGKLRYARSLLPVVKMHELNEVEHPDEDVSTSIELSDDEERAGGADDGVDDEEDEMADFFTPEKLRGYRNKPGGFLASPSPIKKRCRPGSAPFCDLSACCITSTHPSTGETPLNRSSLTTTTTCETDEDEWGDDDEWADTDSTATTGGAARGSLGSIGEDAGELNIHQRHCIMDAPRPPPTPIHSHHHHTQQHQQHYQLHGNQRRLWSTPEAGSAMATDGTSTSDRQSWASKPHEEEPQPPQQVIRIPARSINPFLPQPPAGPRRRSLEIKVPAGGAVSNLGPWTLSRYTLEFEEVGKLGEGRYSVVYKSIRRLDGCAYAVKRLAHRLRSEADRARVLREAFASAALADCPKIVRYHDAWFDDGHLHIQTELCPGGCLDRLAFPADYHQQAAPAVERVLEWRGDEVQLASVLKDVALALHHMHRRGVAHMDVKPTNILVAQDGSFKLADLGHSIVTDGSMTLLEEGDQRYLSQEILAGLVLDSLKQRPDQFARHLKAADIFALGATMYELASCIRLKPSGPEWHRLRSGHIPQIAGISPRLQSLIESMLDPQPMRRPTASQVLLTAILLLVGTQGADARCCTNSAVDSVVLSELLDNMNRQQQQEDNDDNDRHATASQQRHAMPRHHEPRASARRERYTMSC